MQWGAERVCTCAPRRAGARGVWRGACACARERRCAGESMHCKGDGSRWRWREGTYQRCATACIHITPRTQQHALVFDDTINLRQVLCSHIVTFTLATQYSHAGYLGPYALHRPCIPAPIPQDGNDQGTAPRLDGQIIPFILIITKMGRHEKAR